MKKQETICELDCASWPDQAYLCPSFDAVDYGKCACSNCRHEIVRIVLDEEKK